MDGIGNAIAVFAICAGLAKLHTLKVKAFQNQY